MREEEIYKLKVIPEAALDKAEFIGDGFIGEIWSRRDFEEEGKRWTFLQWEPEQALLRKLINSDRGKKVIDTSTGRTISRRYPSELVVDVNRASWSRRTVIFTDYLGREVNHILIGIGKDLLERIKTLEKENTLLRTEIFYLEQRIEKIKTRPQEQLKESADMILQASKARWDTIAKEQEQAQFMGEEEKPQ